ncbi:30658_t:CDS:2 [Gigaspora margarita]|uniref:30658_t:CDS:1 n=1 Tax=Gigaspora margarita TaxID=4874 RepID=A0ABN7UZG3_GIGMA|nr:30658_t:CDS:2 [Gigaspora margarita]
MLEGRLITGGLSIEKLIVGEASNNAPVKKKYRTRDIKDEKRGKNNRTG